MGDRVGIRLQLVVLGFELSDQVLTLLLGLYALSDVTRIGDDLADHAALGNRLAARLDDPPGSVLVKVAVLGGHHAAGRSDRSSERLVDLRAVIGVDEVAKLSADELVGGKA